jgi:hypothetical protein
VSFVTLCIVLLGTVVDESLYIYLDSVDSKSFSRYLSEEDLDQIMVGNVHREEIAPRTIFSILP